MVEVSTEVLAKVKEADEKGELIKETVRKEHLDEGTVKRARRILIRKNEVVRRISELKGQALRDEIARLREDPQHFSNSRIAEMLKVSPNTVRNITSELGRKNVIPQRPKGRYAPPTEPIPQPPQPHPQRS